MQTDKMNDLIFDPKTIQGDVTALFGSILTIFACNGGYNENEGPYLPKSKNPSFLPKKLAHVPIKFHTTHLFAMFGANIVSNLLNKGLANAADTVGIEQNSWLVIIPKFVATILSYASTISIWALLHKLPPRPFDTRLNTAQTMAFLAGIVGTLKFVINNNLESKEDEKNTKSKNLHF